MTQRSSRPPTLAVVARRARVSVPTVSKVLRARPGVSAETRDRVRAVLDAYGYPPATAGDEGAFTGFGAALVDVVVTDIDTGWATRWINALDVACRAESLSIVLTSLGSRPTRHYPDQAWTTQLSRRGTTGIVGVMTEFTAVQVDFFRSNQLPCVVIDAHSQPTDVVGLRVANHDAEREATRHLVELGHRRIAMVLGLASSIESAARHDGYRLALSEARIDYDPALVRHGDFTAAGGQAATADLLDAGPDFTAIVYASDRMAVAGMGVLSAHGRRIPDDVSVIGFDGTAECELAVPALTTVVQPVDAMARLAISHITETPEDSPSTIELAAELVVRASTAAPRP